MAGNHTLGTIRGTIEIDYDGAGIVKAVRDTDKAKKGMDRLGSGSDKVLGAFGKFAGGAVQLAGGIGTVYNALTLVTGALAVVGPLAAAGFAAAPGLVLGFAAAMTIAKIAVAGVGEALGAAGEDSKTFEKSIEKLSPQAQKFARSFREAYPQLVKIKSAIQDAFFKGTAGQVAGVVSQVSKLTVNASGVSRALGFVVKNIVKFATSGKSISGINKVLGGVRDFLYRIGKAVGPVVQAFLGLAGQAGAFGDVIGGKVASGLQRFADFLNGINLKELFATALPIVKSLGSFLADIGKIAMSLFSVFNVDGAESASVLSELASKLADFLQSAQGQDALAALGTAIQAIAGASGQIFLALLQALAPTIVALAPGVADLANQIAGVMVPAINALNPLLVGLAGYLSDNIGWIGPLAAAVVGLAAAYKVYAGGAKAVSAIQDVLTSKIVKNTAAWIANAAVTTAKGIASVVSSIASATAAFVANTASVVANRVAQAASAVVTGVTAVGAWIASTAAIVANRIAMVAGVVAMGLVRGAVLAWTAVQWLLNAALNANPISLVVIAIAALVAGIIYAYQNSETFRNIVQAVWGAIKTAIAATVNWITGTVWPALQAAWNAIASGAQGLWNWIVAVWNGIKNGISTALNAIKSVATSVWNAVVSFIQSKISSIKTFIATGILAAKIVWTTALNLIRSTARTVWSAIVSVVQGGISKVKSVINGIRSVIATVRNAFNSAKQAASDKIAAVIALVKGLPGKVTSALGNLGRLLYNKGVALVKGFINGIASMIGAVKNKVKAVVSAVTDFLPGSPAKTGPLSGKGYVLLRARRFMNDFAQGMEDGSQKPVAALMGAVNPISRAVVPSVSRTSSGASSAPAAVASARSFGPYQLEVDGNVLASFVVDTITGNPTVVSKSADEGSRKNAWSGSGRKS